MTKFKYPEQCTFCSTRIGSEHCLLPYEFVMKFSLPHDYTSQVIELTEVHMTYGIQTLHFNSEFLTQIRTRPHSVVASSIDQSVISTTNELLKSDDISTDTQTIDTIDQGVKISQTESLPTDEDNHESNESNESHSPLGTPPPFGPRIRFPFTWDHLNYDVPSDLNLSITENQDKGKQIDHANAPPQDNAQRSNLAEQIVQLSSNAERSLIKDLTMALIHAYNLDVLKHSKTRVIKFVECLDQELHFKRTYKERYESSRETKLDHPIALAKELVAHHSPEEFQTWEQGSPNPDHFGCILNFPYLSSISQTVATDMLMDKLVHYAMSVLTHKRLAKDVKDRLSESIKIRLSARGHPLAYNWFTTKSRQLSRHVNTEPSSTKSNIMQSSLFDLATSQSKKKIRAEPSGSHTCPAIDENLLNFIDTHINDEVRQTIDKHRDEMPDTPSNLTLVQYFANLTNEFLRHNKSWHNPNSFQKAEHLSKIERNCSFRIIESQRTDTFIILSIIISNLREKHKLLREIEKP